MNANLLRAEFAKAGMTQAEVARRIGMSEITLSRKLTGKREFRLDEVCKLCKLLRISDPSPIFLPELSQICNEEEN